MIILKKKISKVHKLFMILIEHGNSNREALFWFMHDSMLFENQKLVINGMDHS